MPRARPRRGRTTQAGFFRSFALSSLAVMIIAATAMFVHHRAVLIKSIEVIAESSSVATTRMALHHIREALANYVETANRMGAHPTAVPLPGVLHDSIEDMMRDSRVVRIKIYRSDGVVLFSTKPQQIGDQQEANPGFSNAIAGKLSVHMVYRDTFNTFDRATEEDNLVQTYFPVRARPTAPVVGVFEVYTDVNSLVVEAERSELAMLAGTIAMMASVYLLLLMLVYRSDQQVNAQRRTIAEKNALLEQLSLDSMRREERERKRFATELHEGLAQSLSAVKLALEGAQDAARDRRGDVLSAIIPNLQEAIVHARAIAEDLHPPSLDEFGLGPTVRAMVREFGRLHPAIGVEHRIALAEEAVPATLKIAVYRIVESALEMLRDQPTVEKIRFSLETDGGELVLCIEEDSRVLVSAIGAAGHSEMLQVLASELMERVLISKGKLSVAPGTSGTPVLRAVWGL